MLQSTLHPYVAAGVATAAASVIAVTPVAPPLPDIQVPAVQLSAASTDVFGTLGNTVGALLNPIGALSGGGSVSGLGDLPNLSGSLANLDPAAPANIFAPYVDLVTNTFGNLDSLLANWVADPFPFLRQVLDNLLGYAQTIFTAIGNAASTGSLADLSPILTIPETIAQHVTNVFQTLTDTSIVPTVSPGFTPTPPFVDLGLMLHLGLPLALLVDALGAPYETYIAGANSVSTFVDALESGNALGALGALFDAPANIANGFLNGDVPLMLSTATEPLASLIPPIELPFTTVPPNTPIDLTANIPLGGILAPLGHITASAMIPSFCVFPGACPGFIGPIPVNPLIPGFTISNITVGGTPIGGIVPALVNYLPQQLAAAITPHEATAATAATSADLVNGPLGGAGLDGLLNPGDLGATFDPSALTSLLDGGLAPALTGLFDPAAISGIASTLSADLLSAIAGLF
jgi:hypothetical protein